MLSLEYRYDNPAVPAEGGCEVEWGDEGMRSLGVG
jgi:hypothetical protein